MKTEKMLLGIIGVFVLASVAVGGSGGQFVIEWSSIDGGGGVSSGGQYSLSGTVGQPDAGYLYGGQFEIAGGFHTGGELCIVNFTDFAKFSEFWLVSSAGLEADLYPDGTVDGKDLGELINLWLSSCPTEWLLK